MSVAHELHECPCEECHGETLDPDAYCVECMHNGCSIYGGPQCQ